MSEFNDRLREALKAWRTTPAVAAAVVAEVDAFFAETGETRDAASELFIAAIVFNRVTARETAA